MFDTLFIHSGILQAGAWPASIDTTILAQQEGAGFLFLEPKYFAPIFAGVIIALSFELFLTILSVAFGLTAIDIEDAASGEGNGWTSSDTDEPLYKQFQKRIHACELWATVSCTLSLFFACWLAVKLSLTSDAASAAVLGLTIWGLFGLLTWSLNISIGGSTLRAAVGGIRNLGLSVGSLFKRSSTAKEADEITRVVRDRVFGSPRFHEMKQELRHYFRNLANGNGDHESSPEEASDGDKKTTADLSIEGALRAAGYDAKKAKKLREQFENFLRDTKRDELDPERIKEELGKLFKGDSKGLREQLGKIDRESLKTMVAKRTEISEEEVEQICDWIEQGYEDVRSRLKATGKSLKAYVGRIEDENLDFNEIEDELRLLLDDPSEGYDKLKDRLGALDRETIVHLFSARNDFSEKDAEQLVSRVERVRDRLLEQAERLKNEISEKLQQAKRATLKAADEAREVAATTAWWAVGATAVSGAAAVTGGLIAAGL